jgi:flagella basal body P-ring formation protein FlgA
LGKVAKQTLLPGHPIPLNGVREPFVVKQGQAALVVFQSGDLVISSTAVSLQAGGVGELISLRNSDSGITIKGVVQADGSIRVGSP